MGSTPNLVAYTSLWAATLAGMTGEQEQRDRFSYALRRAMAERGVSARMLAKALEVDPRRVAAWQHAKALPNLYEAAALAVYLRVDEALFRKPPEVPAPPPEPYYPLDRYLLEGADSGAAEGRRRASTRQPRPAPGTPTRTPGLPARAVGE